MSWQIAGLFLRLRRQLLQPREIEDVMVLAGDELDIAVAGLRGGEVAVVLGGSGTECELAAIDAIDGARFSARRYEASMRPGFTFIEGQSSEQTGSVECAAFAWEIHVTDGLD